MQKQFFKALPIVAAMLMVACGQQEGKKATEAPVADSAIVVKIGHAAPLTGAIAHLGKDNENGARLAVEEVNQKGLEIAGKKIRLELLAEDDAGDPKAGTSVAQKMVDAKVVAVVGHLNSGVTIPASKIYNEAGIPQISPASTNPEYTQQHFNTAFRVVATDAQQGPALANYVSHKLKVKTVAIVDDATAYGKGLADEFEKTVKAAGIKVLMREATNDKATDFKAILSKIKGKKPDVIMYGGMDATGGPFVKQAKELNIPAKIIGGDGVCTEKMPELAGDAVSNVVCSEAGMALSKMEGGESFNKRFQDRFGVPVQIYAPFTYDAVMVIVDAMKRAQSVEPAKILVELPKTNYKGVIGNIAFDAKGDMKEAVVTLYEYKDNKKSVLDIVKM